MAWETLWHRHPGVRSGDQLTIGERAADKVRNGMGSWPFVIIFLVTMGVWAVVNSVFYLGGAHGRHGFDPYPYILLNLMLSMIAGLQGAILLIAAKRADQVSSELAVHTFQNTEGIRLLLEQNTELTKAVDDLTTQIHHEICKQGEIPPAHP
ncbi:MAG TPA: DUF1003 domain-containing protein [Acidimicrobiales bacterium]|jgi:uncharacterized membrane protein|nr:DUF1003 domain-containing protein [Acidimicrobiales bacterium]